MTFSRLVIPDALLTEVIEHARQELPNECCGLLAGPIADGAGTVTTRFAIENELRSPTEYLSDAKHMLFAFRSMREQGLELLAVYHSHPTTQPVPSRRDIERNTYGETAVHIIVGLAGAEPEVRAWWLTETDYREARISITSVP